MNGQKINGKGIFYGVIGVATLVVAIIGATFAYFTASASDANTITGDMATVSLSLNVEKVTTVDQTKGGMIPMSNGMVEAAINDDANNANDAVCVDDNGNAVCQIYKITLTNDSSAGQFVDGYVSLKGGSGVPTDWTSYVAGSKFLNGVVSADGYGTTMRWAQAFCNEDMTSCSTKGNVTLDAANSTTIEFANTIANAASGANTSNILTDDAGDNTGTFIKSTDVLAAKTILGTSYDVISRNYIRVSNHVWATAGAEVYSRNMDITSALVFNQYVSAENTQVEDYTDNVASYYIVVWLSETGTNQTANSGGVNVPSGENAALSFFSGNVTFVSAQGSEVSATFSDYSRVERTDNNTGTEDNTEIQ